MLLFLRFDENSHQTMHVFVPLIVFLFVAIKLFAKETVPVSFELTLWGLSEELSFKLSKLFFSSLLAELKIIIDLIFCFQLSYDVCWRGKTTCSSVIIKQTGWLAIHDIICSATKTDIW